MTSLHVLEAFKILADQFPGAVVMTNTDFSGDGPHVVYANELMEELTGYSKEEMIGTSPRMLQGDRTHRLDIRKFTRALSRGDHARVQVTNYRKNGEPYMCDISAWPIRDDAGKIIYFMALEREIGGKPGRPSKAQHTETWWTG